MRGRLCLLLCALVTLFTAGESYGSVPQVNTSDGVALGRAVPVYPKVGPSVSPAKEVQSCSIGTPEACLFSVTSLEEVAREFKLARIEHREEVRLERKREARRRLVAELRERERQARAAGIPFDITPGKSARLISISQASIPRGAPPPVKDAIEAANSIATAPYIYGGGHGSIEAYGYDCSSSTSFALRGAGLLHTTLVSGQLAEYGEPGPGKWITIYANAGHVYMEVAGLRWDTSGNPEGVSGPRWHEDPPYPEGYVVRQPPGY